MVLQLSVGLEVMVNYWYFLIIKNIEKLNKDILIKIMKTNILITSAGRRVSLIKAFQTELKKIFPEGKVIAVDAKPDLSPACMVADIQYKVPRLNENNYIDELLSVSLQNNVSIIIPTIDTELLLLSENKAVFSEKGIKVIVSDTEFVKKCRDKRLIHDFFKENNIDVAVEYSKNKYMLPLFIKPLNGSRSVDTYIIKKETDLNDYHFNNDKLMFLEYLDQKKHNEYTCDLYYGKDNLLKCVIPRKRIEVRDGEVSKGKTENNELVPYIKEHLAKINGAIGCLTVQFFKNIETGRIIGIEVNPRFGGGFPLSYLAGGNYPKWLILEYIKGESLDYFDKWEDNLLMLRYDDEILVHDFKE